MSEQDTSWHPSRDEVAHILEELRPIITQLAERDEVFMAEARWHRDHLTA